jgi:ABC-type uncharacterized transport system substrate-binding protein
MPSHAKRTALIAVCVGLALLGVTREAVAHPHVFVEVVPSFILAKGRIVGMRVEWVFDAIFSSAIIRDFDTNRDKQFSPAETEKLKAGAFDNLKEYGYFTHFRFNAKMDVPTEIQDFSAAVSPNGNLVYTFIVRPPRHVDPKQVSFDVMFFDETYYVDLRLMPDKPITFTGSEGCSGDVDRNPDLPDYGGMFIPELLHVRC